MMEASPEASFSTSVSVPYSHIQPQATILFRVGNDISLLYYFPCSDKAVSYALSTLIGCLLRIKRCDLHMHIARTFAYNLQSTGMARFLKTPRKPETYIVWNTTGSLSKLAGPLSLEAYLKPGTTGSGISWNNVMSNSTGLKNTSLPRS